MVIRRGSRHEFLVLLDSKGGQKKSRKSEVEKSRGTQNKDLVLKRRGAEVAQHLPKGRGGR